MPAKKPAPLVTAWSYSRLSQYEKCPRQFKLKHIDRIPEPAPGEAMLRGDRIHKGLEAYLRGKARALPKDIKKTVGPLAKDYAAMRKMGTVAVEIELASDRHWELVPWFGSGTWFRQKIDAAYELVLKRDEMGLLRGVRAVRLIDHKTGKVREGEHYEQLELYVPVASRRWPDADAFICQMLYVDHGQASAPAVFLNEPKTVGRIEKKWEQRAAPIFRDRQFKAKPSGWVCEYCPYSKHKGGPCQDAAPPRAKK